MYTHTHTYFYTHLYFSFNECVYLSVYTHINIYCQHARAIYLSIYEKVNFILMFIIYRKFTIMYSIVISNIQLNIGLRITDAFSFCEPGNSHQKRTAWYAVPGKKKNERLGNRPFLVGND